MLVDWTDTPTELDHVGRTAGVSNPELFCGLGNLQFDSIVKYLNV